MSRPEFDTRIQWHAPDGAFAAVLIRDGSPWFLDGALVGMGSTRSEAIQDLERLAWFLIVNGSNGLMDAPLEPADRSWLLDLLEPGAEPDLVRSVRNLIQIQASGAPRSGS